MSILYWINDLLNGITALEIYFLSIGEYQSVVRNIQKEVVMARMRLGHAIITHSYL